jgi:hypothetical protein
MGENEDLKKSKENGPFLDLSDQAEVRASTFSAVAKQPCLLNEFPYRLAEEPQRQNNTRGRNEEVLARYTVTLLLFAQLRQRFGNNRCRVSIIGVCAGRLKSMK